MSPLHYKINHEFWKQTDNTIVLIAILSPRNDRFIDKKLICVGIVSLFYFHARTFVEKLWIVSFDFTLLLNLNWVKLHH